MNLLVDPGALTELQNATAFYIAHSNRALGAAFIAEFERITRLLLANPLIGSIRKKSIRQYAFRRFPYLVIYQVVADKLRIMAVAHQRRKPAYSKGRA